MSEDMFDVFRGTVKANYLDDNVIDLIHERFYLVLVHIDENARSTIHAALQRAWVQQTLRVPITRQRERDLLIDKRHARDNEKIAATASMFAEMTSRDADRSARKVMVTRLLGHPAWWPDYRWWPDYWANAQQVLDDEERLAVAEQRAVSDAAKATSLAQTRAAHDMVWAVNEHRGACETAKATSLAQTRAAYDAVRATEIARIGPMMKIPDWVDAVVFFT